MIQVIERAFAVLEALRGRGEADLGTLATAVGLQKTTLRNILRTLEDVGAVGRTRDGLYALGPGLVRLAEPQMREAALRPLAQRATEALVARTDETCLVAVLRGGDRVGIALAEGGQELAVRPGPQGVRQSPWRVPTGRVLVAFSGTAALTAVIEKHGLPGTEWNGIDSESMLSAALAAVRDARVAENGGPGSPILALAVPVLDPGAEAVAAIGVHMPALRAEGGRRDEIVAAMREAARALSEEYALAMGGK